MIVANLEELAAQLPANAHFAKAIAYLQDPANVLLPDGRYEIEGDAVYAMAQRYTTLAFQPDAKYEAHQRYIDIQYMVSGCEIMGWAALEDMTITKAYLPEKDVCNGICAVEKGTLIKVKAGQAAVFFPSDAHAPKIAFGEPEQVHKIVIKVAI